MSRREGIKPAERIMVALDVDELHEAEAIARDLKGTGVTFKIGNQLGTYEGWKAAVEFARKCGVGIFADTKFKDIPTTVRKSSRAITRHQPDFFNIMADTQPKALEAAVNGIKEAIEEYRLPIVPSLLGVTVLTTINEEECVSIYGESVETKVLQFAIEAADSGLQGVVCSPHEAKMLRAHPKTKNLLLITPGVRPEWASTNDQERITTPAQALEMGADYLVIGRPITQPPPEVGSPRDAVLKIIEEIS